MFGDRLRKARIEAGLNQRELGEKAGCSDAMVTQMEKGTKTPGIALLAAITKVLGCSADYLLHGTNDKGLKKNAV